jgi:hypothetical protein
MKKPSGGSAPPRTHFEQVPVEIVKKIVVDKDAPKAKKSTPLVPLRIARDEV